MQTFVKPVVLEGKLSEITIKGEIDQIAIIGKINKMAFKGSVKRTYNLDRGKIKLCKPEE